MDTKILLVSELGAAGFGEVGHGKVRLGWARRGRQGNLFLEKGGSTNNRRVFLLCALNG